MGNKQGHTHFVRRTKLLIIMWNGKRFIDRFKDRIGRWIVLEKAGKVLLSDMRVSAIYKGREDRPKEPV